MLQIKKLSKQYQTGDLIQTALDEVSLNLRDNEFVAILGPSGSGKTTLLNMIGGLDRYDSGDLIINGISTRRYRDRDWDSYRNHTIGFVFQSYNLIPHQSILSNVELALTISGVSRNERRKRAVAALEQVGLGDQLHKRPNQMSGGQMQRVAIARALVNNPDILLADEPTGALDTETSVQVMELLKEVAKDRLVVMVTHNPELAEEYATRIVKLRDGKIIHDTDPFEVDEAEQIPPQHKNMGKSSMSFFTALSLSSHNLRTKKGRTFLTSFAGSIGIIGIALILSLSTGVSTYVQSIQKDTMTSYPITIDAKAMDLSSLFTSQQEIMESLDEADHGLDGVYANDKDLKMVSTVSASITENNLTAFKAYLDNPNSEIQQYIGENGIVYSYNIQFSVYTHDPDGVLVNTDGSWLNETKTAMMNMSGSQMMGSSVSKSMQNFSELLSGTRDTLVSPVLKEAYETAYGNWPTAYDEVVLVMNANHEIPAITLYELGLLPSAEYKELTRQIEEGKEVKLEKKHWTYEEICEKELYLIPYCDLYVKNSKGLYDSIAEDKGRLEEALKEALPLKITGVICPKADSDQTLITGAVGYTSALTKYLISHTQTSAVVQAQEKSETVNVINGMTFSPSDDAQKIKDAKTYLSNLGVTEKGTICRELLQSTYASDPTAAAQFLSMSEQQLADMLDSYLEHPEDDALLSIYNAYISPGSYDSNMEQFGLVSLDAPSSVSIYADSFENKDAISDCIEIYNKGVSEADKISYTDYAGLLMSSVTTIIDVISYVLIAFVAVSLVVSSIMIGIITYISVLERTKEIGILRAIGASRRNISQVFNAETFIIGLCAGVLGIGITLLLLIPGNLIIHALVGSTDVNAQLPVMGGVILVLLSMGLTLLGGLIPAKKAARKDPVTALRTE